MIDPRAAELIRSGRLVAFPTETVYGLGANALDAGAVRRIYEVKGRPFGSPLIVHVASIEMAGELAADWPAAAAALAARFWPGPLTLVVRKSERVPAIVTAGLETVGIRMPAHPLALELIRAAGVPIAAPSANRFTELSPTRASHVRASLGDKVDLILDGGPTDVGIESTVLSLAGPEPLLLRAGMITLAAIEAVIGTVRVAAAAAPEMQHPSPGMHERHYSPRTPLVLVSAKDSLPPGRGAWVWRRRELPAARAIRMPRDAASYARRLYGVLHDLDLEGWDWIALETPPARPGWAAILDRVRRAAHPK